MEKSAGSGAKVLFVAACWIVVIAGLKAAAPILVPICSSAFVALLCIPPLDALQRRGVPQWLAITIVVLAATAISIGVAIVVGGSVSQFQSNLPFYQARLSQLLRDGLSTFGANPDLNQYIASVDTGKIFSLIGSIAGEVLSALSNTALVLLTVVFILAEYQTISSKLLKAFGRTPNQEDDFTFAARSVQEYLGIKAIVSGLTAILAFCICYGFDISFAFLWALVAFIFNFIPNIGSFLAAIVPVLLALIEKSPSAALGVAIGYFVINMVVGNVIEPKMLGRKLGLSTLVVFLSMLVWGWIWGPMGMLLSVPLTVIMKIMLEHSSDLAWIAVFLGPGDESPIPPTKTRPPS